MGEGVISCGRYPPMVSSKLLAHAAKVASFYGISLAHREAFKKGYVQFFLGRKRRENCYDSSSFRSAWFDGWDDAERNSTTVIFSTDLTVELKRRT